jgi:phospholipase/carboxylesterase
VSPRPLLAPEHTLPRRDLLLGAAAGAATWLAPGCDSGQLSAPARPQAAAGAKASPPDGAPAAAASAGGVAPLELLRLGPLQEAQRGGLLVVLLHGWRAQGDDLAPLAQQLAQPGQRYLVPAAPLAEPNGGRAWWRLDGASRPAHAYRDEIPEGHVQSSQLLAARQAVQALLRDAKQRYAPDAIAIAGFSQGAMLALDVALAADPPVARVAALSGTLLVDSLPALRAKTAPLPAVFVSHGRQDSVLPFAAAAAIPEVLSAHGYGVQFLPFEGGHQIPPGVVSELRAFLGASTR